MRILPQWNHTARVVRIYRDVLEHRRDCKDVLEELKAISPMGLCNGWVLGKAGWIYESPGMPSKSRQAGSPFFVIPPRRLQKESVPCSSDTIIGENCRPWFGSDIIRELNQLVETMNRDPQFIKQVAGFEGTTLVLSATDTGRELIIGLDEQGVQVRRYTGEPFDAKIRATERVLWAVLSGQMDAAAAFFAGKAGVSGSVITAFRLKNRFLSLLQKHLAHRLGANNKLAINS